jgi:hypothetical protein
MFLRNVGSYKSTQRQIEEDDVLLKSGLTFRKQEQDCLLLSSRILLYLT